jgi:hypothetical protein
VDFSSTAQLIVLDIAPVAPPTLYPAIAMHTFCIVALVIMQRNSHVLVHRHERLPKTPVKPGWLGINSKNKNYGNRWMGIALAFTAVALITGTVSWVAGKQEQNAKYYGYAQPQPQKPAEPKLFFKKE